ncbi:MAG TPA: YIP1 family protein [Vicinamibacterales bacterium]
MTSTAPAAGSTPAPKSLVARVIGILTSPKETFQSVVATPKWFGVLALTTLAVALFTAMPLTTEAGRQAAIDKQVAQMQSFGVQVNDETYNRMEKQSAIMPYTTAGGVIVVSPIIVTIFAGILFAIFNAALGGEASFKQVFSIVTHAGVVSSLGAVFGGLVNYFRQRMDSVTNLGSLVPMLSEKSFVANFLGAIDVFVVWWLLVLAMGLAVLYRRRTQPIAITLFAVYGVIAIAIAVFKSRGA